MIVGVNYFIIAHSVIVLIRELNMDAFLQINALDIESIITTACNEEGERY